MTSPARTYGALLAHRAAAEGDRTFVEVDDRSVTYQEFDSLVSTAAQAFAHLGVERGDRVCIAMPNSLDFLVVSFGLMRLGAIQVPLSLEYRSSQVSYVVADADAQVLVSTGAFLDEHSEALEASSLSVVLLTSASNLAPGRLKRLAWSEALSPSGDKQAEFPEVEPSDALAIIYTSGTTGDPKGVLLCHEHELTLADNIAASVSLSRDDCFYNFYPLHHNTGLGIITGAVLAVGARMFLIDRFSKSRFWGDVVANGCTVFYGMGPIIEILNKADESDAPAGLHPLRACFGIAIGEEQAARFHSRFGVPFVTGYGSTEVNMVAIAPMATSPSGAAGKVLDDFEVGIVDSDDRLVPSGTVGEIVVRPRRPFVTSLGYWQKETETVTAWKNLWVHTGDAGRLDDDGYLYFADRIKDVIRHRGNNVSSLEVENVILGLGDVAEVAVIPVPSDLGDFDQDICAVVVSRVGHSVDPEMVIRVCEQELPKYAVPRYVSIVSTLPKTPTGKVKKALLRAAPPTAGRWDRQSSLAPAGARDHSPRKA